MGWWRREDEMSAGGALVITTPGAPVTFRGLERRKI